MFTDRPTRTLDAPISAAPFTQSEWLVPAPRLSIQVRIQTRSVNASAVSRTTSQVTWLSAKKPAPPWDPQNLLETVLTPTIVVATPVVPITWTVPLSATPTPIAARTHLFYYVFDTTFDTTPFIQSDWPNPRPNPRVLERTWVQNLLQSTFSIIVPPSPNNQFHWPLPQGKVYPVTSRTHLERRKPFYTDLVPAHQTDWPNPTLARVTLQGVTQSRFPGLDIVVEVTPFNQFDWVIPRSVTVPISRRTFLIYYVYDDTAPFAQTDWPIVRSTSRSVDLQTHTQNLIQTTLGQPVVMPFAQDEWPNPRPTLRLLDRTWVQNLQESTFSIVVPPSPDNQFDWPLPRGKAYPVGLSTWLKERPLFYVEAVPTHLTEWPLPIGKPFPIVLRTWVDWRDLGLRDEVPAHLVDWPNPRGKEFPVQLRTFTAGEWNTIQTLIIQNPAHANYIVRLGADNYVVRLGLDNYVVGEDS
jgi:hypothetical protein